MIKNKMALLGAAATLGVMGGAFVSPAQAISLTYNLENGSFTSGGLITGSFNYDASNSTYSAFSLTSTSTAIGNVLGTTYNYTYTLANSDLSGASSTGFTLVSKQAPLTRGIVFSFASSLPSTPGATVNVNRYTGFSGSSETYFNAAQSQTITAGLAGDVTISASSASAVPWETDALSVIGVTTLFGFGVWNKRKRKVDLSK